jgi:hypothetical protein
MNITDDVYVLALCIKKNSFYCSLCSINGRLITPSLVIYWFWPNKLLVDLMVESKCCKLFLNIENFLQEILDHLIGTIWSRSIPHSKYGLQLCFTVHEEEKVYNRILQSCPVLRYWKSTKDLTMKYCSMGSAHLF